MNKLNAVAWLENTFCSSRTGGNKSEAATLSETARADVFTDEIYRSKA
jgi:hypothetical protein